MVDLTLTEMRTIMLAFCRLLGKNIVDAFTSLPLGLLFNLLESFIALIFYKPPLTPPKKSSFSFSTDKNWPKFYGSILFPLVFNDGNLILFFINQKAVPHKDYTG